MKTDTKIYAIAGFVLIATVALLVGGAMLAESPDTNESTNEAPSSSQPLPQDDPVNIEDTPESVQNSLAGAQELKKNLDVSEKYSDSTVSINKDGMIAVKHTSSAASGPELKNEMTEIAHHYSNVMPANNETGELVVASNGVRLMVSSDAAIAHGEDRLKDDAFAETFVWNSAQSKNSASTE